MTGQVHECDVAVIGGGMGGLGFAIWLKRHRPGTSITVLEKLAHPGHKIGESLTSTTTHLLHDLGLTDQVMRRMLRPKFGQSFWYTGPSSAAVGGHLDSRVGETYHVERRPLEVLLGRLAERAGVQVIRGVTVKVGQLGAAGNVLHCQPGEGEGEKFAVRARIVVDASGPAAVVARTLGLYKSDVGLMSGLNYNSYYGYFLVDRDVSLADDVLNWTEDATSHICFPGGWAWIIALTSWEQSPDRQLGALADYLLDRAQVPDGQILSRDLLAARFGCPPQDVVSIGVAVRTDQDTARGLRPDQRLPHYFKKYPGLARVMNRFQLVQPYGVNYKQRTHMAHLATQFAGDGWLALGDAAVFTNPLFSPGMTNALRAALLAAAAVAKALNEGRTDRATFAGHEKVVGDLGRVSFQDTEMLYRGFTYPGTFQRTMFLRLLIGSLIILRLKRLPIPQPVWDQIWARYLETLGQVLAVERQADAEHWPEQAWNIALDQVIGPFTDWMRDQPIVQDAHLGHVFTHYDDLLHRRPDDRLDGVVSYGVECGQCHVRATPGLSRCPFCSTELPGVLAGAR